jgi:hypothetical protein
LSPALIPDDHPLWDAAVTRARAQIAICTAGTTRAGLYGDITVEWRAGVWTIDHSKSLGTVGPTIAACVRDAIATELATSPPRTMATFHHTEQVGDARARLHAPAVVLPLWRQASAGDAAARAQLTSTLPPDYTLTFDGCLQTRSTSLLDGEVPWLETAGQRIPAESTTRIGIVLGYAVTDAFLLEPRAVLVRGARGLCLVVL